MIEIYKQLKEKSKLEILFMIFFIFGSQAVLAISIIFLISIIFQEKNKKGKIEWENILFLLKEGIFYKFLLSIVYPYENIANESFRGIILIFLIDVLYRIKHKKFELKNKVGIISLGLYILGIVWNYFSLGGVESVKVYIEMNKFLLLPLMLGSLYFETNEKEEKIKYIEYTLPLAMVGYFFDRIDLKNIEQSLYVMKGGMVSISAVILPYTIYFLFQIKNYKKMIYIFIYIFSFLLVLKLKSQTSILGLIGVFLIINIVFFKKIKMKFIYIFTVGIITLYSLNFLQEEISIYKKFSLQSREYLIRGGIYAFKKNIFFGVGNGNTQKYFIEYSKNEFLKNNKLKIEWQINEVKNNYLQKFPDTHNIIFDFIAENGIYGVCFSILLCFILPYKMLYGYLKNKSRNLLKYVGGVLGFIISGQAWSIWTRHNQGVVYLILIITIYFYKEMEEER